MISARMSRSVRVILICSASLALAGLASACGTQNISVPKSDPAYAGAVLFSQRCSGCHTLSSAAAHGSALNARWAQYNNGPNFNIRCERPAIRVLYAIENGGFSGAIMPQNVVVGQDAIEVAEFVAKYAGRQAPKVPGAVPCDAMPIGALPSPASAMTSATTTTTTPSHAAKALHATSKKKPT